MSFIYKITNDINNKIYIGKTNLTVEERFKQHCKDSIKPRCEERPLYNAMNKYGTEHFKIEKIEECSSQLASDREIYWISYFNSFNDGYNATKGGDGRQIFNHELIAERLKEYPYPKEIAKEFNCSPDLIYIIAKEYKLQIKNKGQENVNNKKQIAQYNKDNQKFIQNFNSIQEAGEWLLENGYIKVLNSGVRSHISEVANHKRKTAYSFIWKFI